jgi:hypothetical protein
MERRNKMPIKKPIVNTISSISALQGTCNQHEKRLTAKLTKLEAGQDTDDTPVTEATFEEFDGDVEELGKAVIKAGGNGSNTAFIKEVVTNVKISRS